MPAGAGLIPFNRPYLTGGEQGALAEAHRRGQLAGDGHFTHACQRWLELHTGAARALLTHSCTGALEMAALLLDLRPGDEVIMPSFTFVSTASAFALRGAVPVFVDVRRDTLNLDETLVEAAVTDRTRAICVVHYAGVAAAMDQLTTVAGRHGLAIVEDAAQAAMATFRGMPLGTLGSLGTLSFHETKNLSSGEGGALLVADADLVERAEIVWQKGTDRSRFQRGQVDKYTWVDVGSSFLPGEVTAALLHEQMTQAEEITQRRRGLWQRYHEWAEGWEREGLVTRPTVPTGCAHNGHTYYLLLPDRKLRDRFISEMRAREIGTVFHYIPLHSSPAGRRFGRAATAMDVTDSASAQIVRLPMWVGLEDHVDRVLESADEVLAALFRITRR